jgi:hypothetical protein
VRVLVCLFLLLLLGFFLSFVFWLAASNKARLDQPGVKQRLNTIARQPPDPTSDPTVHARKTKLAQRALNNMLSSRLLAKLSTESAWFVALGSPSESRGLIQFVCCDVLCCIVLCCVVLCWYCSELGW